MEIQAHKDQEEELLHLTTPQNHTLEAEVHNKEQEKAPLLLTIPHPHTIEVQARKDEEEALLLQTCALKIDEKEEDSPKLEKEVQMKESDSPPPSPPPPPQLQEVEVIPHIMEAQIHKDQEEALVNYTCALKIDDKEEEHSPKQQEEVPMMENDSPPPSPPPPLHGVEVIPHTMESQVHKEEALIIQTCALKIDDKEEHSPNQGQEVAHVKEDETDAETKENDSPPPLHEVEAILEYEFKNKLLLEEAFTHGTYGAENGLSYERLEYVGDSVLNLMITKEQFQAYPTLAPGHLTRLRAANVDTEKLARVAIKHGLHRYLRHKKPLLGDQIQEFTKGIAEYPLHSNGLIDVPKSLADIVESTIGAIFVDCGSSVETVWKVFKKLLEPIIDPNTIQRHPVTELHEVCQKKSLKLQFRDLWKETMRIEVLINEEFVGSGVYGSKKEIAHNRAAKNALENMEKILGISTSTKEDVTEDLDSPSKCNGGSDVTENLSSPSKCNGGQDATEDLGSPPKCNGDLDAIEGSPKCNGGPDVTEDLGFLHKCNGGPDAIRDLGFPRGSD
ncbi:putative ribonuclease III [Medicago truncatula]|nr:putative ribonuclease III [Medicago truncatula]